MLPEVGGEGHIRNFNISNSHSVGTASVEHASDTCMLQTHETYQNYNVTESETRIHLMRLEISE